MRNLCLVTLITITFLTPAYGLFYNFEDGNQGWEQINGTMKVEKGELIVSGSDGVAVLPDSDWDDKWTDYSIECKMMMETGPDNMGVLLRYQASDTYYIFSVMNGRQQVEIWSLVAGNYTEEKVTAFENEMGEWYTVKVTAEGENFEMYVNDELIIEWSDDKLETGKAGVRTYASTSHFDDFLVKGEGIPTSPGEPGAAVKSERKLATTWARLKKISN